MRIRSAFRTGLAGGLGVLLALAIGGAIEHLATILTYVGAAVFLALGLDPMVTQLQRLRMARWLAMVIVLIVVLGVVALILFLVVPVIVNQTANLVTSIGKYTQGLTYRTFLRQMQATFPSLDVPGIAAQVSKFLQQNAGNITGGVLAVGLGIAGGVGGTAIVVILTLYLTASMPVFKSSLYRLVPMSRRERFADIAEQIFQSVGRYVMGQVGLALVNGILSFVFLTVIGAQLPAVFAFLAFLGSLIPLVGTISGAVLIVAGQLVLADPIWPSSGLPVWLWVAIYYVIYMQVEAYILSPNIMNRAVKVPGVVVVIAALVGGTLLGILGALVAIPVAAAILLIIEQVVIPRQAEA
ncbi:MAG: AI-2E family transporter [Amnibacterium sp.]